MAVCILLRSLVVLPLLLWPAEANGGHSFSIQQVARADQNNLPLNMSTVFARNFLRYGGVVPPIVARSAETASVLAGTRNGEFIIPVSVGADTLYMSIDTGSADLWVFSKELRQNQNEIHGVYKPSVYSSKLPGKTWAISYADGTSANGYVCYDVVGIGNVWVMQQAVEVATKVSRNLERDDGLDGILGLGFSRLNRVKPEREETFFENAKSQLELPLFAAILKHDNVGTYDFGFINSSKYIDELSYVDVDSSHGHWSFNLSGYDLGNGDVASDPLESVIDTGASLVFLPDYIVDAYYQQIIGAEKNTQVGEWTVPCSASLPSFTVVVGNYKAVMLGDLLKLDPIKKGSSQCIGGIQSNMDAGVGIFGHVFLKTQYVVFDERGPRLGFASQS